MTRKNNILKEHRNKEAILKNLINKEMGGYRLDSCNSRVCTHSNEPSCSTKRCEFREQLGGYEFRKRESAPLRWLVGEHMQLPDGNIHPLRTKNKPTNQSTKKLTKERPLARLAIPELKTKIKCTLHYTCIMYNVSGISQARACCSQKDQSVNDAQGEKLLTVELTRKHITTLWATRNFHS